MRRDELKAKRLRETLGAVRELRHTTQAARKHIAAMVRLQRMPARRLTRKLNQLEALFDDLQSYRSPSYELNDYVGDLQSALATEAERLAEVETQVLTIQGKLTRRISKTKVQP